MEITVFMCGSFSQRYQDWYESEISTESLLFTSFSSQLGKVEG